MLQHINRRKLIGSLASAVGILAAPAIVRASSLMSISPLDKNYWTSHQYGDHLMIRFLETESMWIFWEKSFSPRVLAS